MKLTKFGKLMPVTVILLTVAFGIVGSAQYRSSDNPQTMAPSQGAPTLTAMLVDAEKKAAQKAATVDVKVSGIKLTDPAAANEKAMAGQGHLHYQVDNGPIIATTTTKLSFHGLTSGAHKIVVMLAGNDHNPLGPQQTLDVTIP
jgi:hypothetical protein